MDEKCWFDDVVLVNESSSERITGDVGRRSGAGSRRPVTCFPNTISRRGALIGTLGAAALLGGCGTRGSFHLRYRLTVNVAVDDKVISGNSVRQLTWHERNPAWAGMDVSRFFTDGEAVVVDLGSRGLLIATLPGWWRNPPSDPATVTPRAWTPVATWRPVFGPDHEAWWAHPDEPVAVQPNDMPVMVTFTDPNRPGSVRAVDPRNLAATFGPGVSLLSVTAEVTHQRVTHGPILRALPWLKTWGNHALDGEGATSSRRLENNLYPYSFMLEHG